MPQHPVGGNQGAYAALDQILAQRMADAEMQRRAQTEEREHSLRRQEFEQRQTYQDESLAQRADQREAQAQLRRQSAAHTLAGDLSVGDPLDGPQQDTLREGNLGSLIEQRDATVPSTQHAGFAALPGSTPAGGFIRTSQAGSPGGGFYLGSAPQRRVAQQEGRLRQFVGTLPANSPERKALEFQMLTGDNPPAGMFQREPAPPTPSFQLQPLYDDSGRPSGAVRFNQRTGEVEPVDLSGAGLRPGGGSRAGLPVRVQHYLLQLRSQHPQFEDAQAELGRVLANAPDETFDRLAAVTGLRQLYAQPTGQGSDLEQLMRGAGGPSRPPILGGDPPSGSGVRQGGGTITRTELQAVAQRLGISEQQAAEQARARGLQVQ